MIRLSKDYCIRFEPGNIVLCKVNILGAKSKKRGEETLKKIGFFGRIEDLIDKMLNDKILNNDCENIESLIKEIKDFKEEVLETIKESDIYNEIKKV